MSAAPPFDDLPAPAMVETGEGPEPVPYWVSRGHTVLLSGTGDAASVAAALAAEDTYPVLTTDGRAALGLFLCRFDEASSGPHLELHLGALVAPRAGETISGHPAAFLAAFATRRDWSFLSLHLFNDKPEVVALNTEYFGLDAKVMKGAIDVSTDTIRIDLTHVDGRPLAQGQLARRKRPELGALFQIGRLMGWRNFLAAGRARRTEAFVMNRKGRVMPANRRALTLTSADEMAVMRFREPRDHLRLGLPHDFRPEMMQHLNPFWFAYLHPDAQPVTR